MILIIFVDLKMNEKVIRHFPVMAENVIRKIKKVHYSKPVKVADCNFGFGGHTKLILKNFPKALVQAYDLDPQVINYFKTHYQFELSESELERLTITQGNFSSICETKAYEKFDVVLADFGFNSFHLETGRGFSWLKDEPLDMRYSCEGRTCSQIINQSSQLEIMSILQRYGDLKGAKNIAEAIVAARPISTTQQLKEAILQCFQEDKTRKIAQVFQSFRIATNNELKDIQKLCNSLGTILEKGGVFMGITFHSIERDVIHSFMRDNQKLFSKIEIEEPSQTEVQVNSKSKSARLLSFIRKR